MNKGLKARTKLGVIKKCLTCNKDFYVHKCEIFTKKYCSLKCRPSPIKGKKQSKEWVENRIKSAIPKLIGKIPYNKGKKTGKIVKCDYCGEDVYKFPNLLNKNKHFICNRECSHNYNKGSNNYQYKGGKDISTKHTWIRNNSKEYRLWKKYVLERDKYTCRVCGSHDKLEVHHIIPFYSYPELVTLKMNGVTLCHKCHKQTDSFGKTDKSLVKNIGKANTLMFTIPHNFQAYPTVGNYERTKDGILVIFVSDMNNKKYNFLVFCHEYIESFICEERNIKEEDITKFDLMFEKERDKGKWLNEEPGFDSRSPYINEHTLATSIEKKLAKELQVNWNDYDKTVNNL